MPKKQEIKIEPGESDLSPPKVAKIEYQTENIEAPEIKPEIKTEPLVAYGDDSDSGDDSDPENPSCMAFCKGFKIFRRTINLFFLADQKNLPIAMITSQSIIGEPAGSTCD